MEIAYATNLVFVFWLLVAAPYWRTSSQVNFHARGNVIHIIVLTLKIHMNIV